jgi:hypothetical protein
MSFDLYASTMRKTAKADNIIINAANHATFAGDSKKVIFLSVVVVVTVVVVDCTTNETTTSTQLYPMS